MNHERQVDVSFSYEMSGCYLNNSSTVLNLKNVRDFVLFLIQGDPTKRRFFDFDMNMRKIAMGCH